MIVHHVHHKKRRLSRRTVMLIVVVVVVVLCAVIAIKFGLIAAADGRAKTSLTDTKTKVTDATLKLNTLITDDKTTVGSKVAALSSYSNQLQIYSKDVCSDARVLIYYGFVKYHDNCEAANLALFAMHSAASNLYSFLSDEETLAALLPTGSSSLTYTQQYDLWTRTVDILKTSKTGDHSELLKTALTEAARNYAAAWYDVVQADGKKDEAAFNKAEELIKTTHSALKATSAISTKTLQELSVKYNVKYTAYTSLSYTK